VVIHLASNNY